MNKADQAITFAAIPPVTFGKEPFPAGASSTSGLDIIYTSNDPSVAVITDGMITITGTGSAIITASQPGNINYNPTANVSQTLIVGKADQFITFSPFENCTYGDPDLYPGALATSGLAVIYTSNNSNVAVISGNKIQIAGSGNALITATQPGDHNFNPAPAFIRSLTVNKAGQIISFPAIQPVVYGIADFNPGASSSSGLNISYTSDKTSVAEIINGYIHIRGAGNASIIASQEGNNNYEPAAQIQVNLTVSKAGLTISGQNKSRPFLSANPVLNYICSGFMYGEDASVLDTPPSISTDATVDSPAGDYVITISGGNDDCYDFTYIAGILTITKIDQDITFTAYPENLLVNETFELLAVASSRLPVSFESKDPQIASLTGSTITGISRGNAKIRAWQPGNENYNSAESEISVDVKSTHENILHLFTPNNDGFNDLWEIPDLESYGKCEVKVYNRWGKLVFSSPDYHNEWDGTSDGADLPSAAYYFIIKSETSGTITGIVNIVR